MKMLLNQHWLNPQNPADQTEIYNLALYSYACFTTFICQNGKVKGLSLHLERLQQDCLCLFGQAPSSADVMNAVRIFLTNEDPALVKLMALRITVFPKDFSIATPGTLNPLNVLISARSHTSNHSTPAIGLAIQEHHRHLANHKTTNMSSYLVGRAQAQQQGYDDALFMHQDLITEGPTWNIFFGNAHRICTPSLSDLLLPGVTRQLLLTLAAQLGWQVQERTIRVAEIAEFDYAFISNAVTGAKLVGQIDRRHFNESSDDFAQLVAAYQAMEGSPV